VKKKKRVVVAVTLESYRHRQPAKAGADVDTLTIVANNQ
jgi:hypothetical protein